MLVRTPAIVLASSPYRETSQLATLLTRDLGRVRVLAKGIRNRRWGEVGALDLLTYGTVTVYVGRGDLHLLGETAPFRQWARLREDLDRIYGAFWWIELARRMGPDRVPDAPWFRLVCHGAHVLDQCGQIRPVLDWLALRALALHGVLPRLDGCAACGAPLERIATPRFDQVSGGVVCERCPTRRPAVPLSHGTVAAAHYLVACDAPPDRLVLDEDQRRELGRMLANATAHVLERPMRLERLLIDGVPRPRAREGAVAGDRSGDG